MDAPVSGGDIGAKNGKLVTMVGGEKAAVEHVRPLLDLYSTQVEHMGAPGAGQSTKAANQIMIAMSMMSDAQMAIERKDYEWSRQLINRAKWVLSHYRVRN